MEWQVVQLRSSWFLISPTTSSRSGRFTSEPQNVCCPLCPRVADRATIELLYRPFLKPLIDKNGRETSNWLVWAAKFWHHLNPPAFPIEDSRVDDFFMLNNRSASVDKYLDLLNRFRRFVVLHQDWLQHLRQADGGVDGEVNGVLSVRTTNCGTK